MLYYITLYYIILYFINLYCVADVAKAAEEEMDYYIVLYHIMLYYITCIVLSPGAPHCFNHIIIIIIIVIIIIIIVIIIIIIIIISSSSSSSSSNSPGSILHCLMLESGFYSACRRVRSSPLLDASGVHKGGSSKRGFSNVCVIIMFVLLNPPLLNPPF